MVQSSSVTPFSIFFNIGCFILLTHIFSLLPAAFFIFSFFSCFGCCFLTKICPDFSSPTMYWKELPQLQFAYRSPQGTVKPSTCEYSTNKQITCWQGEMQKRYSNLAEGGYLAPHLQFHRHLLNFKDISAPLIFDQAVYNTVCICMWICGLSHV